MPDFTNGSYTVDAPDIHTANLIIDPVDMSHAGRYQCSDGMKGSEDENNSRTAVLIVLGNGIFIPILNYFNFFFD